MPEGRPYLALSKSKGSRSTRTQSTGGNPYTPEYGLLLAGAHLALAQGGSRHGGRVLDEARRVLAKLKNEDDPASRVFHFYAARAALAERRYEEAGNATRAALRLSQQQAIDPKPVCSLARTCSCRRTYPAGTGRHRSRT